ncbi:MAG: type II toxin-antitoxin system RelE/ParE family toxin [Dysgonamonadaceae bacterium]|jgi:plasmid stabilization system protein ParE|nr:type II toxin-antitoxin system RelE/ParE family toxin [Dysgonamonadaceae bacterium]
MDGVTEKKVVYSDFVIPDLQEIFNYGKETFGIFYAERYVLNIIEEINSLKIHYLLHPQCSRIETKSKIYRNIIVGSHLVIYRISEKIEVLRVMHSASSNNKIKKIKQIQT